MGIWVGRYAIVAGEVREHGPWLIERQVQRDDEEVRLLVLADPVDERSAEFAAEVAEAVAELFARESLSITGGLLRALRQAHGNLSEWNRRSLREHRVAVGLTCVAVRGLEATIAQVGPGVVYIAGPEGVRRLATDAEPAADAIGQTDQIEPQFFSTSIEGRTLLLLTGHVDEIVGVGAVGEALTVGPDRTLSELYRRTRGVEDMAAVVITEVAELDEFEDELRYEPGSDAEDRPRNGSEEEFGDVEGGSDLAADSGEDESFERPLDRERAPSSRPLLAPVPHEPESPPMVDSGAHDIPAPPATRMQRFPSLRRQTSSYRPSGRMPGSLSRVGVRAPSMAMTGGRLRAYALIALAVGAVLLLAVCTLPGMLEADRGAQLDDAIVAAQQHIASAAESTDPAVTRSELDAAAAELSRGRSINEGDTRLAALQVQVDTGLSTLDAVVDLGATGLRRVLAFDGAITAPFTPSALQAGGDAVWLVDSQRGRVFRVGVTGPPDPTEVYRADETYEDVAARTPSAIAWDGAGNRLFVLDTERKLFALTAQGPAPLPVREVGQLRSAAAIASYDGNLYILDPAGGEIWRYLPGGDGFDSERSNTLGGIDISDARALVVDGEFYLLGAAGVRHFRQDRELPAMLKGVDKPLSSPAGIAVDTPRKLTYVADRGGRRVVVSDDQGNYTRQYRHPQFFDLRGITLSPDGMTAYVLTGDGIYAFNPQP